MTNPTLGYLDGGPDIGRSRLVTTFGMEMHQPVVDELGISPYVHVWVPTDQQVLDLNNGLYRVWEYMGYVYQDQAVHPRRSDEAKAKLNLKWWKVQDLMDELNLKLALDLDIWGGDAEAALRVTDKHTTLTVDMKTCDATMEDY